MAVFSPDGRWLALRSNESGRGEIYMQAYPGPGGRSQVSVDGGGEPVWPRNSREIFYRNGDKMMAVPVVTQPEFKAGKPVLLFEGPYEHSFRNPGYDVTADGKRFLMVRSMPKAAPAQILVTTNWFEELKRKVK